MPFKFRNGSNGFEPFQIVDRKVVFGLGRWLSNDGIDGWVNRWL